MKSIYKLLAALMLFSFSFAFSQETTDIVDPVKYTASNKGKIYIFWGGNRGYYTNSDIRFRGNDYDFTIYDVKSHDVPKGWHIDYINPGRMTIPQTNFRIGYFITDNYNISLGVDHMKYVIYQDKTVNFSGHYPNQGSYGETVPGLPDQVLLTEDFLTFEHTDGLNYVNVEFSRVDDITKLFGHWDTDKFQINTTGGVGLGILYPKTNTKLLGKERYDEFHISGWGASVKAGLNFTFYKHFFIQTELKGGYIDMPEVRTTHDKADKASHHFFFAETVIALGGIFRL